MLNGFKLNHIKPLKQRDFDFIEQIWLMNYLKTLVFLALCTVLSSARMPAANGEIEWMSLSEAQQRIQQKPKKIFVDLYTDWCGWCTVMDRNVFSHPVIQEKMEKYFYAVKFNAEKEDSLRFNGELYKLLPRGGRPLHQWAKKYGSTPQGLSYPTTIYFNESLQLLQTIPGYHDAHTMEMILEFIGGDYPYRGIDWEVFQKTYKSQIPAEESPEAPAGH
ncbi:DUF255 domain-containing protein [bacterium]|nr:DUF255 domain-containing protein [bacterium]